MRQTKTCAKEELQSLEELRAQVGRLRRAVRVLEHKCICAGADDAGRQELCDALTNQQKLLQDAEEQLRQLEQRLNDWIDLLPHPRWRMVLRCHYLDGLFLSEVVGELNRSTGREFTPTQVYRLHRAALAAAEKLWPLS